MTLEMELDAEGIAVLAEEIAADNHGP